MVEVIATDEMVEWFMSLDAEDKEAVDLVVGLLKDQGPTLAGTYSSAIKGSRKLRELRIQSHGRPLRVFYAFDPRRDAVLLVGGDKTGDARFYERMIPRAEAIWAQYLTEQAAGLHDDGDT